MKGLSKGRYHETFAGEDDDRKVSHMVLCCVNFIALI